MKKGRILTVLFALAILSSVAACGGNAQTDNGETRAGSEGGKAPAGDKEMGGQIEISTGSTGGSFNQLGIGWGQIINSYSSYTSTVVSSAGAVENIRNVSSGISDIGVSFSNQLYQAYAGAGYFDGEQYGDLRALFSYPNAGAYQAAVKKSSGMKMISDAKGKKISVGAPGSGGEVIFTDLFENYYKWNRDSDYGRELISGTTASDALKNDQVDVYCLFMPTPVSLVMDIAATEDIALLEIDQDIANAVVADNPGLYIDSFKAGCYNGVDEDVYAVLSCGTWFVDKSADDEMVYAVLEALFGNLEEFYSSHATASLINYDMCLENMPIPMHKAAAKFFTDKGLSVPAELIVDSF